MSALEKITLNTRQVRPYGPIAGPARPPLPIALASEASTSIPSHSPISKTLLPVARDLVEWRPFENPRKGLRESLANALVENVNDLTGARTETMQIRTANGEAIELTRKALEGHIDSLMFSGIKPMIRGFLDCLAAALPVGFAVSMFERFFVYDPWTQVILISIGFIGAAAWGVVNFVPSFLSRVAGPDDVPVIRDLGTWRQRVQLYHVQKIIDKRRENAIRSGNLERAQVGAKLSGLIAQMRQEIKKRPTPQDFLPLQDQALLTSVPGFTAGYTIGNIPLIPFRKPLTSLLRPLGIRFELATGIIIANHHLRAIQRLETMFKNQIKRLKKEGANIEDLKRYKRQFREILIDLNMEVAKGLDTSAIKEKIEKYKIKEGKISFFQRLGRLFKRRRQARRELAFEVLEEVDEELRKLGKIT